jgi:hypothetical protein
MENPNENVVLVIVAHADAEVTRPSKEEDK